MLGGFACGFEMILIQRVGELQAMRFHERQTKRIGPIAREFSHTSSEKI
jgi:hypothetical protein